MSKVPLNKFLLKNVTDFDVAIEDAAQYHSKSFPDKNAKLYWKTTHENTPKWVNNLFPSDTQLKDSIKSSSVSAVLVVNRNSRFFALSFGYGKTMLNQDVIEPRFGLKSVLNRVDEKNLRSIDTKSLDGFLTQTREQLPTLSPMSSFGIDIEKDFIKAVTGVSRDKTLGNTISGTDSFHTSLDINLSELDTLLTSLTSAFADTAYRNYFEFIDNVYEVPQTLIQSLDDKLIENIIAGSRERIWLAPPEIIEWGHHGGFKFSKSDRRHANYEDIGLESYLRENVPDISTLTLTKLRNHRIFQLTADFQFSSNKWSVYKCLYAEISLSDKHYVLSDGKWFQVDQNYVQSVKDYLDANLDACDIEFHDYETARMLQGDGQYRSEAYYNYELATSLHYTLMDAKVITHGGGNSSIELCDVYKDTTFIHVKRYTKSSGLSHLFNQGKVSAELICSDPTFRTKSNTKIRSVGGVSPFNSSRPQPTDLRVVYAVISSARGDLQLPFFSQVALKNSVYFLKNTLNIGHVSLAKIQAVE